MILTIETTNAELCLSALGLGLGIIYLQDKWYHYKRWRHFTGWYVRKKEKKDRV